jgi:hypothetical protein
MYNRSKFVSYPVLFEMYFNALNYDEHNFYRIIFKLINCEQSEGVMWFYFLVNFTIRVPLIKFNLHAIIILYLRNADALT